MSICLANHSFINEIREISFPLKNSHKIYIRYNTKSLLYIIILTNFKSYIIRHIQGACVWIQNFTELLMNISCSKFPQKLYNYNLHSIVLPLTHFLTMKKKLILIPYTSTWLEPIKVLRWSSFLNHIEMSRKKCRDFTTKMEIFGANSVHVRKLCSEFGQIFMGCASLNAHNLWAETHQSSWEGFLCFRLERGRSQFWEEIHLSSYAITHQSCEEKCPKTNTIRSTLHLYWLKEDHAPQKPVKF